MNSNGWTVRRIGLWVVCPASVLLGLLVVAWGKETGLKALPMWQIALVVGLIVLPAATGAAVIVDRAAARRAARARQAAAAATDRTGQGVVRHEAAIHRPHRMAPVGGERARS